MRSSKAHKVVKRFYVCLTLVALLGICSVLYYKTVKLEKQEIQYKDQLAKVQQKYDSENSRTDEIEKYRTYVQTKKYAEEVAREKFGMVYKNEIIFTPDK